MPTQPDAVRAGLATVTAAATAELAAAVAAQPADRVLDGLQAAAEQLVPVFYDAAGALASAWYDELREEARPPTRHLTRIISEGNPTWVQREMAAYQSTLTTLDMDEMIAKLVAEAEALTQKEVARGFRDTIDGNARSDEDAIGWSRHARAGACKFCKMLARDSAVYRTKSGARFSAHTNCGCVARPEFADGEHGPEASVYQYIASDRERTPKERKALRDYLNSKYPNAPG